MTVNYFRIVFDGQVAERFRYRLGVGGGTFIPSPAVALLIAFTTICFKAVRAARANPVNSLRSE